MIDLLSENLSKFKNLTHLIIDLSYSKHFLKDFFQILKIFLTFNI